MRKLLLLLGIICVFVLSGCGKSDDISGTWVPKMPDKIAITSIELVKQNDFSYKGTISYKNGKQTTSTFKYDKGLNLIDEDPSDAKQNEKQTGIHGTLTMWFNKDFTEAKTDDSGKPEFMFIKK